MNEAILLSSPIYKPGQNWTTPKRARVRQARADGKSWRIILLELGVPKSTAQRICKANSSRTSRKGKKYKKRILSKRDIRHILRLITKNYTSRRMSFEQVRATLNLPASARTIRRELRMAGYRRYIACPRPFITRLQAKKRVVFAKEYCW